VFHGVRAPAELLAAGIGRCLIPAAFESPPERPQGEVNRLQAGETSLLVRHLRQRCGIGFHLHRASPRDPDRASPGPQATPSRPKTVWPIASGRRAP